MTPENPEALRVALEIVGLLDRLGIRYHLGGSYASSIHGVPRQTQDIDLVIDLDEESVGRFLEGLPDGYYREPEAARDALNRMGSFNLLHLASGVKVDCFVKGDAPFDREEFARAGETALSQAPERPLRVKSAEDTILRKLQWYRAGGEVSDRQWTDVLGVLAAQGSALDDPYLERWAGELGLSDLLERVRRESRRPRAG